MKIIFSIFLLCIILTQGISSVESNISIVSRFDRLIQIGSCIVTRNRNDLLSYNPDKQLIPASIWKLVTALAALETLGETYRFKTEFYLDSSDNLYIKGFGDPFLISEEIDSIFRKLLKKGIPRINNIYLDDSAFSAPERAPGVEASLNPYDVVNGALAVNFNTIHFYVDEKGAIRSAEKQTPTVKIMKELGREVKKGKHRINISKSGKNILVHAGQLFRAIQQRNGIPGMGSESNRKTSVELKLFYVHYSSRALKDVIQAMMLYSNNYIANQIYLTMGANEYGYPATWEKSRKFLRKYLDGKFPEYSKTITFDEGSGISRNNRITTRTMIEVLDQFKPFARLLPFEDNKLIKSGTLSGVYSYAGYFMRKDKYDSFVIILNQNKNYRDRVLELMEERYNTAP